MFRFRIALVVALALLPQVAAPAVTAVRVTCTTSATALFANTASTDARRVLVRNPTAGSVYVGPDTLTSSTGFELATLAAMSVVIEPGDTLYCITASGTAVVHTLASRY